MDKDITVKVRDKRGNSLSFKDGKFDIPKSYEDELIRISYIKPSAELFFPEAQTYKVGIENGLGVIAIFKILCNYQMTILELDDESALLYMEDFRKYDEGRLDDEERKEILKELSELGII